MEIPLSAVALTLLAIVLLARWLFRQAAANQFMARTGSRHPPTLHSGCLGLKLAKESSAALDEGRYLKLSRQRFASAGKTYQGSSLGVPFIATIEPENLKALFTRTADFSVAGRRADWWPLLKGGLLVSDGQEWKKSRSLLQPTLSKTQINDLSRLEPHVSRIISSIPRDGRAVDLQGLFSNFTFQAGLDYLLGQSDFHHAHAHHDIIAKNNSDQEAAFELEQQQRLAQNMHTVLFEAGRRAKIGVFRLVDPLLQPRRFARYLRACGDLHRYFDRIIDQRLRFLDTAKKTPTTNRRDEVKVSDEQKEKKKPAVFIDELAQITDDRAQLRWEVSSSLAGSRDTTAGLLAHVFWELARRPEVWRRLREEIRDVVVGGEEGLGDRMPAYEHLKDMTYLRAIINEALRMYPEIAVTFRWATEDTTLPLGGGPDGKSPCFVPKGRRILTSFSALHRQPDVFGADADEFRPERWLDVEPDGGVKEKKQKLRSFPLWTYLPFGGGPRTCPGQNLALVESQYAVVRIVQAFARIEPRDERPYAEEASIVITIKHGAWVGLFAE
ncbi:cytochrome P450 [Xylariomycetidae sp. FL2044]|nr:cytochrome P450 [Xylariomycetidae sp. FL2044]